VLVFVNLLHPLGQWKLLLAEELNLIEIELELHFDVFLADELIFFAWLGYS